MLKMVAFDIDGTLAETFPVIFEAFQKTVYDYSGQTISNQTILATFGVNEAGMLRELVPDAPATLMTTFYQNYRAAHHLIDGPFAGIRELLALLHHANVKTPVVTGKGAEGCQITLSALGLTDDFAPVLTGDSEHPNKAAQLRQLMTDNDLKLAELAYVGDTVGDLENCREVGIHCFSAAWADSVDLPALLAAGADQYETVATLTRHIAAVLNM